MAKTEHEDVELVYQGQIDVLLKSEVELSGRFLSLIRSCFCSHTIHVY